MKKQISFKAFANREYLGVGLMTVCLALGMGPGVARAASNAPELLDISLDELLNVEISSVAKKPQKAQEAAAAVYVLTAEDIRRSGATSLPEALRLVPGVQVAQIDANKWAVSVRGLNARWSGQLLVLMDGRTLYSPLFSGVYWDVQDTLLEDIERIEVIRGPGGTLWGANAVNGVINIITKHASDTQGGLAYARLGNQENGGAVRYGAQVGEGSHLRGYVKWFDRDGFNAVGGGEAHDAWDGWRAGFRLDSRASGRDSLTLQGDVYRGDADQTAITFLSTQVPETVHMNGGNLMFKWQRQLERGDLRFSAYFDQAERRESVLRQRIDTWDVEFQHRFPAGERHDIVWGTGYRLVSDEQIGDGTTLTFTQARRDTALYNLFIQDEIRLNPELYLTLGAKLEHNDYSGWETQPNARLFWQASETQAVWAAWSKAVRTPSRSDSDMTLHLPGPPFLTFQASPSFDSQDLTAYELGYRHRLGHGLNYEVAGFYYDYDNLRSLEPSVPFGFPFFTYVYGNRMAGEAYGLELNTTWQVTPDWLLKAGYSSLWLDARDADARSVALFEGSGPRNQAQLQSHHKLGEGLTLDALLYFVDNQPGVSAYCRLDLRVAWQPRENLELSLVGQNLLDSSHMENLGQDTVASAVPRAVYGQVRLRF